MNNNKCPENSASNSLTAPPPPSLIGSDDSNYDGELIVKMIPKIITFTDSQILKFTIFGSTQLAVENMSNLSKMRPK